MFFPKEMTELELIIPAKDLMAVTRVLSSYGVFHQTDSNTPGAGSSAPNTWTEKAAAYASLERRIQIVMQGLSIDEGQPSSSGQEAMVEIESVRPTLEKAEEEFKQATDQLTGERKRLEQLESTLHQLEPVAEVGLDISQFRSSRYLFSMLGQIPVANVDRLQTSLARVPNVFLTLRSDALRPVVWLAGTQSNADVLDRAARSAYLNPLILPAGYQGTPAQIIETLRREMDEARGKIADAQKTLEQLARSRQQQLRDLLWQVHTSRVLADAILRFGQLRYTYIITGWAPTSDMDDLTARLKLASKEILIETVPTKRSGHNSNVPVALQQSKFLKPFQLLVNTYARPRYGELDPTILIAFMFPILFGAMFGDIGQGLVLALLGWLVSSKKVKALSGMASLGGLVIICGLSAAFFGWLYGSVFGFEGVIHAVWFEPRSDVFRALTISVAVGVALLILGFLIGIFNGVMSREWSHLIVGHSGIAGFLLYISLLGFGGATFGILPVPATVFMVLAILAGAAVMFSDMFIRLMEGHRPLFDGGIVIYLIQAGVELFEVVISFLSNTISFVRIGAFAVAHAYLMAAVFTLAEMAGDHSVGYWITVIVGNIIIIGLEGLIVSIQTMRLSYYEFFSKFFTGGGMRFEPLSLSPSQEE
jgi:V/A-type H+-transporting ATPase subunit I